MIASPAAGGIVDIDRDSGEATVIPLDADVGTLIAAADAVWAVASPNWESNADEQRAGLRGRKHPAVWEEPTGEDIARHQETMQHIRFIGGSQDDHEGNRITAGSWREDEDGEPWSPAPIWRVHAGSASRIGTGLEQPILAAAGRRIVGVGRLPGDPVIKHRLPYGSVSWRYPGSVVVIDGAGTLEVVGPVPGSGGVVCADHGRVWLLGFEAETDGDPAPEAREVLLGEGRVAGPLDMELHRPVAVLDGFVVDVVAPAPTAGSADSRPQGAAVVRFLPVDAGDPSEAGPVDLTHRVVARTGDGDVWFGDPGASALFELRGDFPDRAVVALFHAADRPGIRFARRWRLYDELGNPCDHEYAGIGLMEDVESTGGGLPEPGDCVPDTAGVVWFQRV